MLESYLISSLFPIFFFLFFGRPNLDAHSLLSVQLSWDFFFKTMTTYRARSIWINWLLENSSWAQKMFYRPISTGTYRADISADTKTYQPYRYKRNRIVWPPIYRYRTNISAISDVIWNNYGSHSHRGVGSWGYIYKLTL